MAALAALAMAPLLLALVHGGATVLRRWHTRIVEQDFADSFVFLPRQGFAVMAALLAAITGVFGGWLAGSPVVAMAVAVAALAAPALAARLWRVRRQRAVLRQVPEALELLASTLQAGVGLSAALQSLASLQASPLREELQLIARKQRLGVSLDQASAEFAARCGGGDLQLFAAALAMTRRTGGSLADVLRRLAATLRAREQIARKVAALTAQGRLQGWIVGLLPIALLIVMQRLEPDAMRLLYTTRVGWLTLTVLVALEVTGALLLRRLVRIEI